MVNALLKRYGELLVKIILYSGVAISVIRPVAAEQLERRRVLLEEGNFSPLYGLKAGEEVVHIHSFLLDVFPVTNGEFLSFIKSQSSWRKENALPLLVDEKYLRHLSAEDSHKNTPVVNVSYFAAEAFCEWRGGRLPTTNEWEYAAAADETRKDASRDPTFVQKLLEWYAKPVGDEGLGAIGMRKPNAWGIHDLHGLIWEWTQDFNSVFVSGDNRRENDQMKNLFCGVGAVSATDKANYAAFMRYALRNSLQGKYTMENLGFRCAYDHSEKNHGRN